MQKLEKALARLDYMLSKGIDEDRAFVDSSMQRFKIIFELVWKTMKAFLEYEGRETAYPRQVFNEAFQGKLIDDESIWLQMMSDSDEIYKNIKSYLYVLQNTFKKLKILESKIQNS